MSSFSGWTDNIDRIPRLAALEKVYGYEVNKNNCLMLLCLEKKSEAFIITLVNNVTQPVGLVFDSFAGYYSIGRAFMLLPKHCRCSLGDKKPYYDVQVMVQLVEVFAHKK